MLAQLVDVLIGAVAVEVDLRQLRLEEGIFLVGEVDIGSAEVLLDAFEFARSGDRDDELGPSCRSLRIETAPRRQDAAGPPAMASLPPPRSSSRRSTIRHSHRSTPQ
jgi:hypothetical protein